MSVRCVVIQEISKARAELLGSVLFQSSCGSVRSVRVTRVSHRTRQPASQPPPSSLHRLQDNMASGIKLNDKVLVIYSEMKLRKNSEDVKKRKKIAIFFINKEQTEIVHDEENELLFGQMDEDTDAFQVLQNMLPKNECRYALLDVSYENNDSKKQDLVLVYWVPDLAKVQSKMVYASSLKSFAGKLNGLKLTWQVVGTDVFDRNELAEKLSPSVTKVEGKSVKRSQQPQQLQQQRFI